MTAKEKKKIAARWRRADAVERKRIEEEVGVSAKTLYDWLRGKSLGPRGRPRSV